MQFLPASSLFFLATGLMPASAIAGCPPEVGSAVTAVVREPAAGSGYDTYTAGMARMPDGGVVVVGSEGMVIGTTDWLIIKYDATLATVVASTLYDAGANLSDDALAIAASASGSVYVCGSGRPVGPDTAVIVLYSANLATIVATTSYDAGAGNAAAFHAITVDGSGNVIAAGYEVVGGNLRWIIRKYDAGLTMLLGYQSYDGPTASGNDQARAVLADPGGTIYVAGWQLSTGGTNGFDWVVRVYSPDLISGLSATTWNGSGNDHDEAYAILRDSSSGDILVGGTDVSTGSQYNWVIRRYDAALGSLVSEIRHDGPASGQDSLYAMAWDDAGRIVAGGYTQLIGGGDGGWGIGVFNPVSGALLGHAEFAGHASEDDQLFGLATGPGGVIYATGYDYFGASNQRWRVARYACPSALTTPPVVAPTFDAATAYPNPFRPGKGDAAVKIAGVDAGSIVKVYSGRGRLVRTLVARDCGEAAWDGTSEGGDPAGSGIYTIVGVRDGAQRTVRVILQR